MATDYDAPRKTEDDSLAEDSIEELKARRIDKAASTVDVDETELAENLELPGADLSDGSLSGRVLPRQAHGFTSRRCLPAHPPLRSAPLGAGRLRTGVWGVFRPFLDRRVAAARVGGPGQQRGRGRTFLPRGRNDRRPDRPAQGRARGAHRDAGRLGESRESRLPLPRVRL